MSSDAVRTEPLLSNQAAIKTNKTHQNIRILPPSCTHEIESISSDQIINSDQDETNLVRKYSWIIIILFGQCIAVLNAGTAVFSKFLVQRDISLPFCQSLLNYILLNTFFLPLGVSRYLQYQKSCKCECFNQNDVNLTQTSHPPHSLNTQTEICPNCPKKWHNLSFWTKFDLLFSPKHATLPFYTIISILDVQGNFLIVKAYKYTSMLAVQLIDSANLPFVLLFTFLFLSKRFTRRQLLACGCSLFGLMLCIATDAYLEGNHEQNINLGFFGDGISYTALMGDGLVLAACMCYALSNVIQEAVLTDSVDTTQFQFSKQDGKSNDNNNDEQNQHIAAKSDPILPSRSANSLSNSALQDEMIESDLGTQSKGLTIQWDRTMEYLAFLGICGTFIGSVEGLIFEHKALKELIQRGVITDTGTLCYGLGYTCCIFLMYLLMPVLLQNSGAVVLNLSLLMTDAYSAVCAYFFFQQKISIIYVFAFVIIAIGLVLYNHTPKAPKTPKTPTDASNCDVNDNNDQYGQYGQYGSIQSDNGDDGAV